MEYLDNGSPAGSIARGFHGAGATAVGAAKTLTAADSNKIYLLDTAAGSIVTLPTPAAGGPGHGRA